MLPIVYMYMYVCAQSNNRVADTTMYHHHHIQFHILWLISACTYNGKWNNSMHLLKDMCI